MREASLDQLEQAAARGGDMPRIELANRLIEFPAGSPECERGLAMLREISQGPQGPAAQWLLGIFYLQATSIKGAHAEAATWLQRAAAAGVAPAIDRLANLHLRGLGVPPSRNSVLELLQRLAGIGFQQAAWDVGYLLDQEHDVSDSGAATAFARACALGFPPAYYSLGLRFAQGRGVLRDAAFARALLKRANDAGFPDALAAADEWVPEPECGRAANDWYERLRLNHAAGKPLLEQLMQDGITIDFSRAVMVPKIEAHFAALGHPAMAVDGNGRLRIAGSPGSSAREAIVDHWERLSEHPRVEIGRNFVTREECAHLVYNTVDALARPDQYMGRSVNGLTESRQFTGRGRLLGALTSDTVVRTIERRIAARTGFAIDRIEPCSIIAYEPGEEYQPHVDYFSKEQIERNRIERNDPSGQRVATFLMCLQAPVSGGETVYESTGLSLRYESGMAALHFNVTPDGAPDRMSVHRGRPVERGEKWLMRTTLREHSLYLA